MDRHRRYRPFHRQQPSCHSTIVDCHTTTVINGPTTNQINLTSATVSMICANMIDTMHVHQMDSGTSCPDSITRKPITKQMSTIVTVASVILIHLVFVALFIIMHHPRVDSKCGKTIDMLASMLNHTIQRNKISSHRHKCADCENGQKQKRIETFFNPKN